MDYNLRAKTERNGIWEQIKQFNDFKELIIFISSKSFSNCEITKNGKLFFVFTVDEKTKMFLDVINEISGDKEPEIIPKTAKKARKSPKKEKEIIIGS